MSDPSEPNPGAGAPRAAPETQHVSSASSMLAGTPLGAAMGAIGAIPKDQLIQFLVSGVRSLLSQPAPVYRVPPPRSPDQPAPVPPTAPASGNDASTAADEPSQARKRAGKHT